MSKSGYSHSLRHLPPLERSHPEPGYNEREAQRVRNHPMFHTTACLAIAVDAFCDGREAADCICDARQQAILIEACMIEAGDQIGGRVVESASIEERNEWLTVFVRFNDGSTASYPYYAKVAQ